VLLDWMIEGISGIEVCRRLRRSAGTSNVPIIMLTGRGEEQDRVRGLETGADDYVTKPFSPRELVRGSGAVLRRVRPRWRASSCASATLRWTSSATRCGVRARRWRSGPTEFRLLRHFLEHPGRVFSRERLLDAVWRADSEIEPRTVDVHIRRLRKAINADGRPELIRTVRSAGYALDDDAA
jgi:two-component system phosphate regulon response regulator PhoB